MHECHNCAHSVPAPNNKRLCIAPRELRPLWAEHPNLYTPMNVNGKQGYLVLPREGRDCKAYEDPNAEGTE